MVNHEELASILDINLNVTLHKAILIKIGFL